MAGSPKAAAPVGRDASTAEARERPKQLPRLDPGAVFAGYRIEGLLARGGMGVVYRAVDIDLDRTVALKIIAPEHTQDETAVARFKSEARIAASLEHPNIVPIHHRGEFEGVLYLAMRLVPGTNLREVIDRAPLDLDRTGRIVSAVARALDVAHARGLVHRDVKPANILLSGQGEHEQVYLTDFGLTKRLGAHGDLTRPGGWVGTPDYVAPEQIQAKDVDGRADVYSLGCVLYEVLTGDVAYPKGSDVAKLWAHVADPPPLPCSRIPELVAVFDEVVAKATAKDPADRYATAGEFAAAVRAATSEQRGRDLRPAAGEHRLAATRDSRLATRDELFVGERVPPPPGPPPAAPRPPAGSPPAAVFPGRARPAEHSTAYAAGDRGSDDDGSGKRHRGALIGGAGVVVAAGVALSFLLSGGLSSSPPPAKAKPEAVGQRISGDLGPVPTNRVPGDGRAVLRLNGNVATVSLTTDKLLDGASHALHIHAGARGQCPTGRAASVHNGHLSIATKSGVPFYGHAVTALTTTGNTDPERSLLAFNRYPKTGEIRYERTINVGPVVASYIRKNNAVVVVHGIDYNHNGLYDGTLDRSDLDRTLPGESTAPALCGTLIAQKSEATPGSKAADTKTAGQTGSTEVFASVLEEGSGTASTAGEPRRPTWLCRVGHAGGAELGQA
jgi:serine/threonine-protein kinase